MNNLRTDHLFDSIGDLGVLNGLFTSLKHLSEGYNVAEASLGIKHELIQRIQWIQLVQLTQLIQVINSSSSSNLISSTSKIQSNRIN